MDLSNMPQSGPIDQGDKLAIMSLINNAMVNVNMLEMGFVGLQTDNKCPVSGKPLNETDTKWVNVMLDGVITYKKGIEAIKSCIENGADEMIPMVLMMLHLSSNTLSQLSQQVINKKASGFIKGIHETNPDITDDELMEIAKKFNDDNPNIPNTNDEDGYSIHEAAGATAGMDLITNWMILSNGICKYLGVDGMEDLNPSGMPGF